MPGESASVGTETCVAFASTLTLMMVNPLSVLTRIVRSLVENGKSTTTGVPFDAGFGLAVR